MNDHRIIPDAMLQKLLAYLQERPYKEVGQAIPALQALPTVSDFIKDQVNGQKGDGSIPDNPPQGAEGSSEA